MIGKNSAIIKLIAYLLIIFSSLSLSFSSLLSTFALSAWLMVYVCGVLPWVGIYLFHRFQSRDGLAIKQIPAMVAGLALNAAATTQAIAANELPSGLLPLHSLPHVSIIYLFIGGVMAFIFSWISLLKENSGVQWAAFIAACLYSSIVFFRSSAVLETGYPFVILAGFAVLAILPERQVSKSKLTVHGLTYWKATIPFLLVLVLATIFSPVPGQSLTDTLELFVLIILAAILSVKIVRWTEWQGMAWIIVAVSGGLPILLGMVKIGEIFFHLGGAAAISYRLHPTEMGGANLIARSILTIAPLGLALWMWSRNSTQNRLIRFELLVLQILVPVILLWARSFEGFFAWLVAIGVYLLLSLWPCLTSLWRRLSPQPFLKWGTIGSGLLIVILLSIFSIQQAIVFNSTSFNGRVTHWKSAYITMLAHPFLGGGPDNEYIFSASDDVLLPFTQTREIQDDPLYVIAYRSGITKVHAHNLFLEIGAFTGITGLVAFAGSILVLLWVGLKIWREGDYRQKIFAAACLAGLAGELAWGMLDVMRATPPFFSSPVWVLSGLLLALPKLLRDRSIDDPPASQVAGKRILDWVALLVVVFVIFFPSLASNQYASGFLAYQKHQWQEAGERLNWAARLDPLSAHYRQMLASVAIQTGQYTQAEENLSSAVALKQSFSPYLMDSARLAWLQGDLNAANRFYEEAIACDPLESWSSGSHAELGLLRAFQGDDDQSIGLIKKSLEFHPDLVNEPYWVKLLDANGNPILAIDPIYTNGKQNSKLELRLLERLGKSDLTSRHFMAVEPERSLIGMPEVLAALRLDYQNSAENKNVAILLLAANAEVARLAGYTSLAEQAYLDFQNIEPASVFGFRDLAKLYQKEGQIQKAQTALEKALEISPKNIDTNIQLVNLQLARERNQDANNTYQQLIEFASDDSFHFNMFDTDVLETKILVDQASDDKIGVQEALTWITYIRGLPEDYLLLSKKSDGEQAVQNCWIAYSGLINIWVRPYDNRLWQVASCLASSGQTDDQLLSHLHDFQSPFSNHLLAGHLATQRNHFDQAINEYSAAIESSPNEGGAYYFLGKVYQSLGQAEQAQQYFEQASELDPLESLPLLASGVLYQSTGQQEIALRTLEAAVARTPGWDEAQLQLGNLLLSLGRANQAAPHYREAQLLKKQINPGPNLRFYGQFS